jgi:hypothetical protein
VANIPFSHGSVIINVDQDPPPQWMLDHGITYETVHYHRDLPWQPVNLWHNFSNAVKSFGEWQSKVSLILEQGIPD